MRNRKSNIQREDYKSLILETNKENNYSITNMMKYKDRTEDFGSMIKGMLRKKNKNSIEQQPLIQNSKVHHISFFTKESNIISKAIVATTRKLEELAKRKNSKTNFHLSSF